MRFFRRIAGILGFVRDEGGDHGEDQEEGDHEAEQQCVPPPPHHQSRQHHRPDYRETGIPRKGFSVPVKVAVDRQQPGPILIPCKAGDGGVQGLRWYAKSLKIDEDGDVANEFLDETISLFPTPTSFSFGNDPSALPRFEARSNVRHAKVRRQFMSPEGKFLNCIEHQGGFQLV
ncbi:unnamed protein product [Linum tenue]|uniref:Uncharacterized protein n=1 Tax=Linum tenue TaxID=586396 RepID=A0AAV0PNM0_9ROSI|nr:unnamed protein product [Linum tenue]